MHYIVTSQTIDYRYLNCVNLKGAMQSKLDFSCLKNIYIFPHYEVKITLRNCENDDNALLCKNCEVNRGVLG